MVSASQFRSSNAPILCRKQLRQNQFNVTLFRLYYRKTTMLRFSFQEQKLPVSPQFTIKSLNQLPSALQVGHANNSE